MNVIITPIEGLLILEPRVFDDERGYFYESYNKNTFKAATGLDINFVQDNQARSTKNVLRGLHYQNMPAAQSKLIRVIDGTIWDVVVDLRKNSKTYGHWYGVELSLENKRQFYIPKGFAHGYSVLSETSEVFYKCDEFYNKASEAGVNYADPAINIDWKINLADALVSEKDLVQPMFKEHVSTF